MGETEVGEEGRGGGRRQRWEVEVEEGGGCGREIERGKINKSSYN